VFGAWWGQSTKCGRGACWSSNLRDEFHEHMTGIIGCVFRIDIMFFFGCLLFFRIA
jgi:hypothetical protein